MNNTFLRIVAAVIGGVVGYAVVSGMFQSGHGQAALRQALIRSANEANKKLPMMVDKDTRLDKVEVGDGTNSVFIYNYTLPNVVKSQMDDAMLQKVKELLRPQIIANYKSNATMEQFRTHNVELDYRYVDKNGDFMFEQDVSPKDF